MSHACDIALVLLGIALVLLGMWASDPKDSGHRDATRQPE